MVGVAVEGGSVLCRARNSWQPLPLIASLLPACRSLVQPQAEAFAKACSSVDPKYVLNFGEEVSAESWMFI